ncbi:MAG: hypothetical protein K8T26_00640 [Lentisphaerae bacterium]|nr:hypothetical protein [Lentisphaerota bacterium]
MRTRIWLAALLAWGVMVGGGSPQAAESAAFVVTVVVPRGDTYAEPAEGVLVMTRQPVVFHVRVLNTAGETKQVQVDLASACALELTDTNGRTRLVTRKRAPGADAGGEVPVQSLVDGLAAMVTIPFDAAGWDGVPELAPGAPQQFDVRAVYRSVNGLTTYSKAYTVIVRL